MFSVLWLLTAMVATMAIVHMMPWCVGDLCYALLTCEQKNTQPILAQCKMFMHGLVCIGVHF